jgi:hypothetical protein
MTRKSSDYWAGYDAETARIGARPGHFESLAQQVSRALGRDEGRKARILQRSPHVFAAMDAEELGQASSRELATRELRELDIDPGDNDPLALLDAHHGGRKFARDTLLNAGAVKGGAASFNRLIGGAGAQDSAEDFIDRYTKE